MIDYEQLDGYLDPEEMNWEEERQALEDDDWIEHERSYETNFESRPQVTSSGGNDDHLRISS